VGVDAGKTNQGTNTVAIGSQAGLSTQTSQAIAIGYQAGQFNQGSSSIAIGAFAGTQTQTANSIILNASGSAQNATTSGFYVNPIRTTDTTNQVLFYNTSTKEVTYSERTYGSFVNTATVTPAAADTAYILPVDTTTTASNVTLSNTGTITIAKAGIYNIQFSIQLANADNGNDHTFNIWVRKNGTDFGNSNTQYTVVKGGYNVAALNIVEVFAANDNFELVYAVEDTDVTLAGLASQASPYVRPATPSVILTVVPVGA
jgi:hypothetical protein